MLINFQKFIISDNNLSDEELHLISHFLPHVLKPLEQSIKYLAFQFKLNSYCKEDWAWLVSMVDNILNCGYQGWLYRSN